MKTYMLLFLIFITGQSVVAQSAQDSVENTLHRYIEGSAYNKLDMLESAFTAFC